MPRGLGFFDPLFRKVDILPAREPILFVPQAFTVTDKN
jgi:hypothetical protein